jgi:hypothetical protein
VKYPSLCLQPCGSVEDGFSAGTSALEKLAIAGMALGLFQDRSLGIWAGLVFLGASYVFTLWEAKQ